VQQVEAMKEMVDDFSEYAKPSKKQTVNIDLPTLVRKYSSLCVKIGVNSRLITNRLAHD